MTQQEKQIMIAALPIVEAVPAEQDSCWPGDGPAHDDHCSLTDHAASAAAVQATVGLCWEFESWHGTAEWFREARDETPTPAHRFSFFSKSKRKAKTAATGTDSRDSPDWQEKVPGAY